MDQEDGCLMRNCLMRIDDDWTNHDSLLEMRMEILSRGNGVYLNLQMKRLLRIALMTMDLVLAHVAMEVVDVDSIQGAKMIHDLA